MRQRAAAALLLLGCGGTPSPAPQPDECLTYHWTRALVGSGTDASVAPDGTIVAVSEVQGLHVATVLDDNGTTLATFPLDPFTSVVRIASGGRVVAAAADGRIRSFQVDGSVSWTTELGFTVVDLVARADAGAIVSGQATTGVVAFLDAQGNVKSRSEVRTAVSLATDEIGQLALTSRDACTPDRPCGAGFDPNQFSAPSSASVETGGVQTSAVVLLDATHLTSGGFISNIDARAPLGPVFIRSGLVAADALVVQASALSVQPERASIDVDPGPGVTLRDVDTEASPDRLLGFAGRQLAWDHGFEPLDDSGRAHVLALFVNRVGIAVDINGDVYQTHHILKLAPDGSLRLRYDKPNDGIANDLRLAGMDQQGHIVLSGRFEGTQDFDPSVGVDTLTATAQARHYITVLSGCD